jgi:hypothetical protein
MFVKNQLGSGNFSIQTATEWLLTNVRWKKAVAFLSLFLFIFTLRVVPTRADVVLDSSTSGGSACCFNGSGNVNAGAAHTVGSGTNRLLIAGISIIAAAGNTPPTSSAATWTVSGVQNMTYVGSALAGNTRVDLFVLVNPDSGAGTASISFSGSYVGYKMGSVSYTGVDQTTPLGNLVTSACANITSSQSCSINVPTGAGSVVFAKLAANTTSGFTIAPSHNFWGPTTSACINCNSGGNSAFTYQGSDFTIASGSNNQTLTALTSNGSASPTNNFAIGAFSINPASASATTNTGSNSQTSVGNVRLTFANVSSSGTTTISAIDPNSIAPAPSGFTFCPACPAYDISTTATYSPPVSVCISAPNATNVSQLKLLHFETSQWIDRTTAVNLSTRTVCGDVTTLSPFAVAEAQAPTAAPAQISGRVTTPDGAPVAGVLMILNGSRSDWTLTDSNGNYLFDNLASDNLYSVAPLRANFSFNPVIRSFSLLGNKTDAAFTAIPDALPTVNVIDVSEFFVRQHYLDFLGREPNAPGLAFWNNEIISCGADVACLDRKRINVSAAFYLSIEFQETGYLVERIYKTAFGDATGNSQLGGAHTITVPVIRLNEFLPDTQAIGQGVVVGRSGWQQVLENNKQAFTSEFVQRSRFVSAFPLTMTAAQFVDKLNANAGNPLSLAERNHLINELAAGMKTRAQVLRAVAEDPDLNNAELNRGFVLMQYFGYLRRNPNESQDTDYTGYDFWLTKLNQFNGNFVNAEMVKAFISSTEYRQRFAP